MSGSDRRDSGPGVTSGAVRVGQGFDAHRFASPGSGRPLWLAGIRWTDDEACGVEGLDGDSDGDVAAHALIDALLLASGLGDIGSMFGVGSDSAGAGRHGAAMLGEVRDRLTGQGWRIVNATVTVIGNAPRVSVHRDEAESALSAAVGAPVSLGATTTDHMGFTGRGEGIAAIATALVERID